MPISAQVIEDWYQRVAVSQRAHYFSADHFGRRKYWLGIPAVARSTIVGTSREGGSRAPACLVPRWRTTWRPCLWL